MSAFDETRIVERLEVISHFAARPETVVRDLERARQTVIQQASTRPAQVSGVLGLLLKNRAARIAAVVCVGALIALILLDRGIEVDGATAALAQVMHALEEAPIMHKVLNTSYEGPTVHRTEDWYDFRSRTVVSKYSTDGRCVKIGSLNYGTKEHIAYDAETGIVTISYHIDVGSAGDADSAAGVVTAYLKDYKFWGAEIERERSRYEGTDVDVYHLQIEPMEKREKQYAALIVNAQTSLPIAISKEVWNAEGVVQFSQGITFDFPPTGPTDIYDLGAPRSAEVVVDIASKQRYERSRALEQRMPQLEEEFKDAYRLAGEQVLLWIPPSMASARVGLEQTRDEIERLVDEQVEARLGKSQAPGRGVGSPSPGPEPQMVFRCFESDGVTDWRRSRATFAGGVSFKQAFESVIGLTRFEYEIPHGIDDINVPGDWVVRRQSSREERIAALEEIVQEHTGRSIHFQAHPVQREVVVARGTFHFQPLSGTYRDLWIHVYADQLDPDARGGGGSGSLAKFIRYLGEINLNQQVIDETEGDPSVEVHYGWHESGYIRKITHEEERVMKRRLVLDNVARQTGLAFRVEQRTITVWLITER